MQEGYAVRRNPTFLRLRLGDHLVQTVEDGDLATVQTAVALLRTVFEDHYVDPEHKSCLFFHGCTLAGSQSGLHDFTVVHRGDRVILSEFTFRNRGPSCVAIPLENYTAEVLAFANRVLARPISTRNWPDWRKRQLQQQSQHLTELASLALRMLQAKCSPREAFVEQFHEVHGHLKRPLELQVVEVLSGSEPWKPVMARCRVLFGPIGVQEVLPMRLNGGDIVRARVEQFTNAGVVVGLDSVGSGGLRPGDRLYGLQMFYP